MKKQVIKQKSKNKGGYTPGRNNDNNNNNNNLRIPTDGELLTPSELFDLGIVVTPTREDLIRLTEYERGRTNENNQGVNQRGGLRKRTTRKKRGGIKLTKKRKTSKKRYRKRKV